MTPNDIAVCVAWIYLGGVGLTALVMLFIFGLALFMGHRWRSSPQLLWKYALTSIALWPLLLATIIASVTVRKEP